MPIAIVLPLVAAFRGFFIGKEMASTSEDDDEYVFVPDPEDEQTERGEESDG